MNNKGQFRFVNGLKKITLAFKLQVVEEVESGQLSQDGAQRKYSIQSNATILVWLRKDGRLDWSSKKNAMGKKPAPNKKIAELEKGIKRLEAEKTILNMAIDIAGETLNTDIRKKYLIIRRYSLSYLLLLKKACIRAAHSFSSTPVIISVLG